MDSPGRPAKKSRFGSQMATTNIVSSQAFLYSLPPMATPALLLAWVGATDLRARTDEGMVGLGPVAQALAARRFDEVILLSNYAKSEVSLRRLVGPAKFGPDPRRAARAFESDGIRGDLRGRRGRARSDRRRQERRC